MGCSRCGQKKSTVVNGTPTGAQRPGTSHNPSSEEKKGNGVKSAIAGLKYVPNGK